MPQYISKIILNGVTQIDLTQDSVAANNLLSGESAHGADGAPVSGNYSPASPSLQTVSKTYTPTESQQTEQIVPGQGYDGLDEVDVTVNAIPSNYVGTGVSRKSSSDLTANGATVTAPAGYYENAASKTVASGTEGTPSATKGAVSNNSVTVTPSVTNAAGYIAGGTHTGTGVSVSASELVSGTYNVTSSGTKDVTNYASASVPAGTAGTPTASKGTVSNHSVSVTPSVTNTGGYISGGTKTGTAVTVSASELVSGSETKTANGTYDVTNLAELVVNVSGGGSSKNVQAYVGYGTRKANSYGATDVTLTVAKTGTYTISWCAARGSSSGTMGTNLHVGNSAGTNEQTWTGTYWQNIKYTGRSLTQGQVLTLYANSGSNSRSIYVGNLVIEEE